MISTPNFKHASATSLRNVSTDIFTSKPTIASTTGNTLFNSSSTVIISCPGLVETPPTSIISTPSSIIAFTLVTADSTLLNFPPSENESGVTFNMPIIFVLVMLTTL